MRERWAEPRGRSHRTLQFVIIKSHILLLSRPWHGFCVRVRALECARDTIASISCLLGVSPERAEAVAVCVCVCGEGVKSKVKSDDVRLSPVRLTSVKLSGVVLG